jgi:hypothetical protein
MVVLLLLFGSLHTIDNFTNIFGDKMDKAGMNSQTLRIVSEDVTDYHITDGKTGMYLLKFQNGGLHTSELSGYPSKKVQIGDSLSWKSDTDTDKCSFYIESNINTGAFEHIKESPRVTTVQTTPRYVRPTQIHPQSDTTKNFGKLFGN